MPFSYFSDHVIPVLPSHLLIGLLSISILVEAYFVIRLVLESRRLTLFSTLITIIAVLSASLLSIHLRKATVETNELRAEATRKDSILSGIEQTHKYFYSDGGNGTVQISVQKLQLQTVIQVGRPDKSQTGSTKAMMLPSPIFDPSTANTIIVSSKEFKYLKFIIAGYFPGSEAISVK